MAAPAFTTVTKEREELNQYWFSAETVAAFVKEIQAQSKVGAAFVSTPSLYFSLTDEDLRSRSKVLEFDRQWEKDPGFVFYDYRKPEEIPITLFGAFDYIVIDPPFITEEVWEAYTKTARLLLCPGGKLLCTTVAENAPMMKTKLGVERVAFRPKIPNLVYQYDTFTSYRPTAFLDAQNPEIPAGGSATDALARAERESYDEFVKQMTERDRTGESPIGTHLAEKARWDRIPEGLTEYPEGGPQPAPEVEHTPEYLRASELREMIPDFRRLIDQACKPLDRVWKSCVTKRKAVKEGNEEKGEKADQDLAAARSELQRLLAEMRKMAQSLPETGRAADLAAIMMEASTAFDMPEITRQQYQDFIPSVQQKFISPLFNHQKGLLSEMKAAKRAAAATHAP
eukprot:TRINITY_DN35980_c0_g1_i1.p1 TRINITY_DN35980_c0_g1~~TRINITY_DN35980_c0_g1_i1.p1  ORF type:complete len:422 (+),score=157.79 TRINITY_DN35980_c0_g1_i1:74-1267(+)